MNGGTSHEHDDDRPSHPGNAPVNHGLDDQSPEGLDSDEQELRDLLHQAVRTVEPADGTLEHLRRAVPARRARKRQALVGVAATVLFLGTAVPAALHVSRSTGDVNPSMAGQASATQGGTGQGKDEQGDGDSGGPASGKVRDKGEDGGKTGDKGKDTGTGKGGGPGGGPAATSQTGTGLCTAAQLGSATGNTDGPDAAGAVYGTFRVYNISSTSCTVTGSGTVSVLPQGAADGAKVTTSRHVSGDAASSLPDPSAEATSVTLRPGDAYAIRFAWVPSETCPTTGGSGGTDTGGGTAEPSPSETAGSSAGSTDGNGVTSQLLTEDGTADGSVVVSHTAETGSPTASATVGNACAGTVYYTGLLTGV